MVGSLGDRRQVHVPNIYVNCGILGGSGECNRNNKWNPMLTSSSWTMYYKSSLVIVFRRRRFQARTPVGRAKLNACEGNVKPVAWQLWEFLWKPQSKIPRYCVASYGSAAVVHTLFCPHGCPRITIVSVCLPRGLPGLLWSLQRCYKIWHCFALVSSCGKATIPTTRYQCWQPPTKCISEKGTCLEIVPREASSFRFSRVQNGSKSAWHSNWCLICIN